MAEQVGPEAVASAGQASPEAVASAGQASPEAVASAEQIELSIKEATAPPAPRDSANWAAKVDRLEVGPMAGVRGTNVDGRRLTGPVQGFGKMLQKSYRMDVGSAVAPTDAIALWKEHFPEFWPKGNIFAAPLTGINPGEVALLDLAVGGVKLSTGVLVLYADAESFTLMCPEGHQFAGWITFSAERSGDSTIIQAQALVRASDPLYELGLMVYGYRKEDRLWIATLTALGRRLGVESPAVTLHVSCVDARRQWRHAGNIRHNSMVRSVVQTVTRQRRERAPAG